MTVLKVGFVGLWNADNAYVPMLFIANREFFPYTSGIPDYTSQAAIEYTLGSLDTLNSIFPDHDTAAAYYYTNYAASFMGYVNSNIYGSSGVSDFFSSTDFVSLPQGLQDIIEAKQPLASTLTSVAALTIASDMLTAIGSPTGLAGFASAVAVPLALDTMSTKSAADYSTTAQMNTALANKVDKTTTVNGHALSGNVVVTTSDLGLSTVATSGDYNDLSNKPTIPAARSFSNPTVSLNSAAQISTTRDAFVSYTVNVTCTMSLTSGQSGTVVLEYADDSGFTTNVKTVANPTNANSGTLTVGLGLTQVNGTVLSGMIPAGKYRRVRTVNNTGTPTFTMQNAQEVLV